MGKRRNGKSRPVERLPVEVIGDILSRVEAAGDVIRASVTCRMWREAFHKHLHSLSFHVADDESVYKILPSTQLENLITGTIFQTTGLRKLSVLMDKKHWFSAIAVAAWLLFTRETLHELFYEVHTTPFINLRNICECQNLKVLTLSHSTIVGVEPNHKKFPCLTSLTLSRVRISVLDLNRLLSSFPKIERLGLFYPFLHVEDEDEDEDDTYITVKLQCPTILKTLFGEGLQDFNFTLETNGIEYLDVKKSSFGLFKLIGNKNLKHVRIHQLEVEHLDMGDIDNLETLDISRSYIMKSELFPMNIKAPKLKRLRIWGFIYPSGAGIFRFHENEIVVDFERMALCLPQLSHLSIFCDVFFSEAQYNFEGLSSFENVVVLELGWDRLNDFWEWADGVLKYCPNVKKLSLLGVIPERKRSGPYCKNLAVHSSSMVERMRKYQHVDVEFVYLYESESDHTSYERQVIP